MKGSFFDAVDQAHEQYKERHRQERPFVDDACQCMSCRSDCAGIAPCEAGEGKDS